MASTKSTAVRKLLADIGAAFGKFFGGDPAEGQYDQQDDKQDPHEQYCSGD